MGVNTHNNLQNTTTLVMSRTCRDFVSRALSSFFTSVWRQVEELEFSLADH